MFHLYVPALLIPCWQMPWQVIWIPLHDLFAAHFKRASLSVMIHVSPNVGQWIYIDDQITSDALSDQEVRMGYGLEDSDSHRLGKPCCRVLGSAEQTSSLWSVRKLRLIRSSQRRQNKFASNFKIGRKSLGNHLDQYCIFLHPLCVIAAGITSFQSHINIQWIYVIQSPQSSLGVEILPSSLTMDKEWSDEKCLYKRKNIQFERFQSKDDNAYIGCNIKNRLSRGFCRCDHKFGVVATAKVKLTSSMAS